MRKIVTRSLTSLGAGGALVMASATGALAETEVEEPDTFTSAFTVMATPDTIISNEGVATPGPEGATGTFNFRINSDTEVICYDITTTGVEPPYQSPAKTATHIHEAVAGEAGPPRIAFPNPEGDGDTRTSSGCLQGPFTTGVVNEGVDTGEGFTLAEIESNPSAFFADTHTEAFPAGAVRGQLTVMPVGGVDTGFGGAAAPTDTNNTFVIAAGATGAAVLLGVGGTYLWRRTTS